MYRNPFCFLCRKETIKFSDTCLNGVHTNGKLDVKRRISMLIGTDTQAPSTRRSSSRKKACNEREMFDWVEVKYLQFLSMSLISPICDVSSERSSDFSNSVEFERQTASEIAISVYFSCKIVQKHSLFRHGFINKPMKKTE